MEFRRRRVLWMDHHRNWGNSKDVLSLISWHWSGWWGAKQRGGKRRRTSTQRCEAEWRSSSRSPTHPLPVLLFGLQQQQQQPIQKSNTVGAARNGYAFLSHLPQLCLIAGIQTDTSSATCHCYPFVYVTVIFTRFKSVKNTHHGECFAVNKFKIDIL